MTRIISTTVNGVTTYHITEQAALPQHYGSKAYRRISKHNELKNSVDFIAEFNFTGSSRNFSLTNDGFTLAATGEYPPQIKIFDLADLSQMTLYSLKCMPEQIQFLSNDWSKLLALRPDRKLEFYDKGGQCITVPLPFKTRAFAFSKPTSNLVLATEESQLLRLNLELGRFLRPVQCGSMVATSVTICESYQLITAGFENGDIEFFDPRDPERPPVASVNLVEEVSKTEYSPDGMKLAVGLCDGSVTVFDIRSSKPLYKYSHRNKAAINTVTFSSGKLITSDNKSCRLHDINTGEFFTSFETRSQLNSVMPYPNSGLLFGAVEDENIQAVLIPELGSSPRWASFLDNVIADVEADKENNTDIYSNYRFISREELESYEFHHLIRSSNLKPYLHGFLINKHLYSELTSLKNQGDLDEWSKEMERLKKEKKERDLISKPRKIKQQDLGDLEISNMDSRRLKKRKRQAQKDPYYIAD